MQCNRLSTHDPELLVHHTQRLLSEAFAAKFLVDDKIKNESFMVLELHPQYANLVSGIVDKRPEVLVVGADSIRQVKLELLSGSFECPVGWPISIPNMILSISPDLAFQKTLEIFLLQ